MKETHRGIGPAIRHRIEGGWIERIRARVAATKRMRRQDLPAGAQGILDPRGQIPGRQVIGGPGRDSGVRAVPKAGPVERQRILAGQAGAPGVKRSGIGLGKKDHTG